MDRIDVSGRHEVVDDHERLLIEHLTVGLLLVTGLVGLEGIHMPLKMCIHLIVGRHADRLIQKISRFFGTLFLLLRLTAWVFV